MNAINTAAQQTIKPYTIKELEAMYGKMGAMVIWQMRQQDWSPKK